MEKIAKKKERHCAVCGKSLAEIEKVSKYCSKECRMKAVREETTESAGQGTRTCVYCGKELPQGFHTTRYKYCNEDCRKRFEAKIRKEKQKKTQQKKANNLATVNAAARAAGMTYGEYVAYKEMQTRTVLSKERRRSNA